MGYWDEAPLPRDQIVLIATTLGDRIPDHHPVRLFQEILASLDWSSWERHYCRVAGQPAIPPLIVAGAILYGLSQGIRSSRRLEWACGNAVDFMWLVEGRYIDHSTFCNFRTRFDRELKDLFRQLGRLAMGMGLVRLNQVALDGTRVRANSSPHATASAKTLEERLQALDVQVEEMFAAARQTDQGERDLFGEAVSANALPPELADLKKRQAALHQALEAARKIDAKRQQRKDAPKKAAKVPVADAESSVLPNKEGGYAPNHTPLAAVDGQAGLIVDCDVIAAGTIEAEAVIPTVERIEANFEVVPRQMLADAAFPTGPNLTDLERRGVEPVMPAEPVRLDEQNPAQRSDPTQPLVEADWPKLPRNPQSKKLDKAAFVYDAGQDCYYCPMGRRMDPTKVVRADRQCGDSIYQIYGCPDCSGCPLAGECLGGKAPSRSVARDQYESARETLAVRMRTPAAQATYARRAWMAETPNALIKAWMGLRQFLLRGLDKVGTEWRWACTAYNLRKMVTLVAGLRARFAVAMS
jgi:transposase